MHSERMLNAVSAAAVTNARACAHAQPANAAALLCVDSAEGLAWVGVGRANEGTKRPQRIRVHVSHTLNASLFIHANVDCATAML